MSHYETISTLDHEITAPQHYFSCLLQHPRLEMAYTYSPRPIGQITEQSYFHNLQTLNQHQMMQKLTTTAKED